MPKKKNAPNLENNSNFEISPNNQNIDFDDKVAQWKSELKNRIQTIFKNALTEKEYTDLLSDWHGLHDQFSISDVPNFHERAAKIHDGILKSRIMVRTLSEFIHTLKLCGYNEQAAQDVLNASQKDVQIVLNMGYSDADIYGYGLQVTKTKGAFIFEPMVLGADNFDPEKDNSITTHLNIYAD